MNFSRLIKAAAVVGLIGFGSHAVAATNVVQNFEGFSTGDFVPAGDWTAGAADISTISNDTVTAFGITGYAAALATYADYDGDNTPGYDTQVLNLATEGTNVTYAAQSANEDYVYVDTILKIVGSDTAPAITDATVQTAVYLDTVSSNLYAYAWTNNTANGWVKLTSATEIKDGDWIRLKITIDYSSGIVQSEPRGKVFVNGVQVGSQFVLANMAASWIKRDVSSVSFQGTGMVDNFVVTTGPSDYARCTVTQRSIKMDGNTVIGSEVNATTTPYMGSSYGASFTEPLLDVGGVIYRLHKIYQYDETTPEVLTERSNPVSVAVTPANGFETNGTYYVEGRYIIASNTVTYAYSGGVPAGGSVELIHGTNFVLDISAVLATWTNIVVNVTPPGDDFEPGGIDGKISGGLFTYGPVTENITVTISGDPIVTDPIVITDNGTLTFGEIVFGSPTNTVSFTANGTVTGPANMYLVASTNLAAANFTIPVSVTATAGTPPAISGTIAIDPASISGYNPLFFKGLSTTP